MKTYIIVDPFSTGSLIAPALKKQGHKVYSVLSSEKISNYMKSSYTGEGFENKYLMSINEVKEQFHQIDGVIVGSEAGTITGDLLSEYYGVKGNSSNSSELRRDKYTMQQALKENKLDYIETYKININNYHKIVNQLPEDKSFVLKPLKSAGSDNVLFFQNKIYLLEHLMKEQWKSNDLFGNQNDHFIIQEYISSQEYVVDMIVNQNEIFIVSLCKYEKGIFNQSKFVYKSLNILDPNNSNYQSLIDYAKQCVKALKINYGAVHMELFHNDERTVMIEAGARLHGGVAPLLFKQCYQPDLLNSLVYLYTNDRLKVNGKSKLKTNGKIVFLINTHYDTYIQNSDLLEAEFSQISTFSGGKIFFEEGKKLPLTKDLTNIIGIVWLVADDLEKLNQDERKVRAIFEKYLIVNDEDNKLLSRKELKGLKLDKWQDIVFK
ncbi:MULTISPECIES: ATP-grasp domain-containing protein [Rodentibacter]|uniref:ATP-grasp domain-containing protein n=1 Tax=Rodentibacter TaxID=1960084 RepID=UPI001CFD6FD1|nr:ATP-grasp domain-containing protein [Rodentibacter sp. JRC1]GJI55803.1 hypothetical protein HEMROJRC1_09150 [Rodentibacter sp. JRC1]